MSVKVNNLVSSSCGCCGGGGGGGGSVVVMARLSVAISPLFSLSQARNPTSLIEIWEWELHQKPGYISPDHSDKVSTSSVCLLHRAPCSHIETRSSTLSRLPWGPLGWSEALSLVEIYRSTTHLNASIMPPTRDILCLLVFWHNMWLPCTEMTQQKAPNTHIRGYFICLQQCIYGIRELTSAPPWSQPS